MYRSTTAYENMIRQSSRTFKAKITVNGTFSITEGIKNIKYNMSSMAADTFSIGSTVSQYVDVEMHATEIPIENQSVSIAEGLVGCDEWIPMGEFTAERPKVNEETVTFTAYDNMMKTECAFFTDLPDETTTIAVLDEISKISGVDIVTESLASYPVKKPSGHTCRELLGLIAQLYGCFAICNRSGAIELKWYEDINYSVPTSRYWDAFTHNDYPYEFQRIVCATGKDEEGNSTTLESGSGTRELVISNPYMTQSQLELVASKLNGFAFMPGSIKFLGDNRLDPWDILTVEDRNGNSFKVPCMKMTHTHDGGMTTEVQAVGESETEQEYNYQGPTTEKLDRFETDLALIKEEFVLNSRIVNLAVDNLNATTAQIKTLLAGSVSSGDVQTIVLNSLNTTIADATIKSAMIESLQFDKITGFEVNTSRVNVHSDDGKSIWSDNTIQISDANRVRVQIGKDASDDYNIYIWDKDGNLMFDPLGLTKDGINRPIIRDAMIADDAEINGKKLNIESVAKEINDSGVTLKSTVIKFDTSNQTLDFAFNQLTESMDEVNQGFKDQTTAFNVIQGQVNGIISENSQIKSDITVMNSQYNAFQSSVSGIEATLGDHTSKLNEQGDAITEVNTSLADYKATIDRLSSELTEVKSDQSTVNSKMSTMEQTVNGFNTRVTKVEADVAGKSANHVGAYTPTTSNSPASSWTTTAVKDSHVGDIFLNTSTGDMYTYVKSGSTYSWSKQDRVTTSQMESAINVKANEITTSVSSVYATKSDLTSTNSKVSSLETWKNTAEQKITDSAIISTVTGSTNFKTTVQSQVTQTMNSYTIKASQISLEGVVTANETFKILSDGSLQCIGGTLGGFTITSTYIRSQSGSYNMYIASYGYNNKTVMKVQYGGTDKFVLNYDGAFTSKDATIEGTIESKSGNNYTKIDSGKINFGYKGSYGSYIQAWNNAQHMVIYAGDQLQLVFKKLLISVNGVDYIGPYYTGTKNGLVFVQGICVGTA